MLDFSQKTRGYGFVRYFDPADAQRAITIFNGYEIIRDVKLAAYLSIDNCRLFVGNIPKEKTSQDILNIFRESVEGISTVIMYPSAQNPNHNRGFAFVEFETHLEASKARRQLHPRNLWAWNQPLYVDWADPIPAVSPTVMSQVSVLFLNNLPHEMTGTELEQVIRALVNPYVITRIHKVVTFAFINCLDRPSAEFVKECLVGLTLFGRDIAVDWARPREYSSHGRQMAPDNFCLSVPISRRRAIREMTTIRRSSRTSKSKETISFLNEEN
ncbi:probable RNA-binding protein 46 [Anthonomus grandis grandis]|uniref:probable RNA-binding protein 46 n=1 Tax=Anthonomus grandis grandis TaxID=2921223 RepID=UPI00216678B0|nr:probable RNA-binding protein 46 [Anthonomus grandis grandis]